MAAFSNYLEDALINHVLRNTALTSPTTVYVGLFTTDPTDAGSGTEVSGNAYARLAVEFDAPSNGVTQNTNVETFPTPTPGNWGTVTHFGIFDALTGGNLLYHGALTTSKLTAAGDPVEFAIGDLTITHA